MSWFVEAIKRLGLPVPRVWVESGTFRGDTTAQQIGHFGKIITIELNQALADAAEDRFVNEPSVVTLKGDSAAALTMLRHSHYMQEPAVFYLDGHWSGEGTAYQGQDVGGCPLLRELAVLGQRKYADIIVIDDARLLGPSRRAATASTGRSPSSTGGMSAWRPCKRPTAGRITSILRQTAIVWSSYPSPKPAQ